MSNDQHGQSLSGSLSNLPVDEIPFMLSTNIQQSPNVVAGNFVCLLNFLLSLPPPGSLQGKPLTCKQSPLAFQSRLVKQEEKARRSRLT